MNVFWKVFWCILNMFWVILDMAWVIVGHVWDMSGVFFGHVSDMFGTCFGHVLDRFWTCFGQVFGKTWDKFWAIFGPYSRQFFCQSVAWLFPSTVCHFIEDLRWKLPLGIHKSQNPKTPNNKAAAGGLSCFCVLWIPVVGSPAWTRSTLILSIGRGCGWSGVWIYREISEK